LFILFGKFPINFYKTLHNFFSWDFPTSESRLSFFFRLPRVLLLHIIVLIKYVVYFEPQITTNIFSDVTSYTWDELCHGRYRQQQGRSYSRFLPTSRVLAIWSLLGSPPIFLPVVMYSYYINAVTTYVLSPTINNSFFQNCTHLVPLFISEFFLFSQNVYLLIVLKNFISAFAVLVLWCFY
jgi:hypothetical protein